MRYVLAAICFLFSAASIWPQTAPVAEPQGPAAKLKHRAFSSPGVQKPAKSSLYDDRRPRMAGSSTGYIDNAVIGTQVRFRFDGDFDLRNPDRAEFFYAKCGCYRPSPDPNAAGPGSIPATSANLQEVQLNVEYAPSARFSILAETPARWIQFRPSTIGSASGIGDFRAGFKLGLIATDKRSVTFQFRTYFPTGNSRLGLGTNHYSIEPTILYHERLTKRLAISGQLGDWHPIGGSTGLSGSGGFAGEILEYGFGTAYDALIRDNYRVTPVVEFVGWSVLSGFVTGPPNVSGSGVNIVNAKLGTRVSFGKHHSIYAGYGRELTHSSWYTNMLRLEYRFAL
jgi:hypothetical protein